VEDLRKRVALLEEIVRRATRSHDWPPDLIWPEKQPPYKMP